jgi:rfaE bifunctional protein nucleotidyltransferase chain/domain
MRGNFLMASRSIALGMTPDPNQASRVLSWAQAEAFVRAERSHGRRIVFTNGVFDLLHPGHVRYLQHARSLGDVLIVGLNADLSVRRNKGVDRPITPEHERAEILAALECVDAVVVFDQDTPADIVRLVQPDVLVKGADWPADQIVGRDTVEARGGRVVLVPVEKGHSTSAIVKRIRDSFLGG